MSDITIVMTAEEAVSKAMEEAGRAAKKLGDENKQAADKTKQAWGDAGRAFKDHSERIKVDADGIRVALAGLVVGFGAMAKSSLESFAQQEKADKQLAAAIKQLGLNVDQLLPKMKEMASAFQQTYGVSDDMVQGIQTMLLRFGTAPEKIEKTVDALLNYSAATGTDAESATWMLVKALENGGKGLNRMGVEIDATGDKAKDLDLVVDALAGKFGGAAAANADSFSGRLAKMGEQFEELKEAFGGFLVQLEGKLGLMQKVNSALSEWNYLMSDERAQRNADNEKQEKIQAADNKIIFLQKMLKSDEAFLSNPDNARFTLQLQASRARVETLRKQLEAAREERKLLDQVEFERSSRHGPERFGGPKVYTGHVIAGDITFGKPRKVVDPFAAPKSKAGPQGPTILEDGTMDYSGGLFDEIAKSEQERENAYEKHQSELTKINEEGEKERLRNIREAARQQAEIERARAESAEQMQEQIFDSFNEALGDQLEDMSDGEEFDAGEFAAALVPMLIGFGVGAYAGPQAGQLAQMLSGFAINKATKNRARGFADGGWVDEPEYHAGGHWAGEGSHPADTVPAMLTPGERVLSLSEIVAMGGREGVERAVRGGGGTTVINNNHFSAMDSQSLEESFAKRGGTALRRVTERAEGDAGQMLHRMRRGA